AVISAKCDAIAFRFSACDPYRNRKGLAAGASVANHVSPGMQLTKQIGKFHLFRAVERGHWAGVHSLFHRDINIVIGIAEYTGGNAHVTHVNELPTVEVPDFATLGPGVVAGPLIRQKHFGSL